VVAIFQSLAFLRRLQVHAACVAPTTLEQKCVPDFNFLRAWPTPPFETPIENFLIRAAFERSIDQLVVIHAEKSCTTRIEHCWIFIDTGKIVCRQLTSRLQSDLVQHSRKIDQSLRFDAIANWRLHLRGSIPRGHKVSTYHFTHMSHTTFAAAFLHPQF